jgi:hypothetical protein
MKTSTSTTELPPRARALIAAVRARGNELPPRWGTTPREDVDVRDAAHEAHHAFVADARTWERETIHRRLLAVLPDPASRWIDELAARVVEREVVIALGLDPGDFEGWIFTSIREAVSARLPFASDFERNVEIARMLARRPSTKESIARVLALADAATPAARVPTLPTSTPRTRRRAREEDSIRISGLQRDHEAALEAYAHPAIRSPVPIEICDRSLVLDPRDAWKARARLRALAERAHDDGDEDAGHALADLAERIAAAARSRARVLRP